MGGHEATANDIYQETTAVTTALTTPVISTGPDLDLLPRSAAGQWQAVPSHSQASFTARVAGRAVRGRLPLTGGVRLGRSVEETATELVASTSTLSTFSRVLDRILTGPGFLDAEAYPQISFRSERLTRVPTGWRAIGRLRVKGTDHELACRLTLGGLRLDSVPRLSATSHWVLDSSWITGQRLPGLSPRVEMTTSVLLEPAR
jgi:polyisoprenoid-binding protein YceI